ncbi:F-box protein CPR1-like [Pistacia vera]|uniref:F-box protein CPR1-like n=1 Tax=Pistacia vera TaxID=55513 RepID=UPI0012639992|nr:F-box protein CPR1-like [Pistacia vera]
MIEHLEELILEILIRLPVKSLVRFRCVSKSWCAWIDSQHFISLHLQHSINTQTNLHVILSDCENKTDHYSLAFDEVFDEPLTKFNNVFTSDKGYKIVGSCNGLLCLSYSIPKNERLILWNPFTRRYKKLPTARVSKLRLSPAYRYGFGYDDVSNDYKVLKLIPSYGLKSYRHIGNEAEVYSLRLNSWKRIENFPYSEFKFLRSACFVNGSLYWLVYFESYRMEAQDFESPWLIVAFSLEDEEFRELPLPSTSNKDDDLKYLGVGESYDFDLAVLDGCLCFLKIYDSNTVEVWVMKQYGEEEFWSRLHLLIPDSFYDLDESGFVKSLAYSKNGEKLLLETQQKALIWYDLKKSDNKVYTFPDVLPYFDANMCFESLVSLGDGSKYDGSV